MPNKPTIIVAPLNWGIGHATRCVPIINDLINQGYQPIITSDGDALRYLQMEFPTLPNYELPSYGIQYAKKAYLFKLKLLLQVPHIRRAVKREQQLIKQIIVKENIKGIISDNRFGVYSKTIPSVYITHQLQVFSGITTFFTTMLHQKIMRNFTEIWVPDTKEQPKISGKLSKNNSIQIPVKYIGILSRFSFQAKPKKEYDILVLLSGTEPQRSILENKLIQELKQCQKKVLFVRGILSSEKKQATQNSTFCNFLTQTELEKAILQSELVIARSGYSTIMDLAVLQKKAFFIPTPGQSEQEYLAKHLKELKIANYATQKKFTISMLDNLANFTGFDSKFKIQ